MNTIKVASLYRQILNASHIYAGEDGEYVDGTYFDIKGEPENEVIRFSWDIGGMDYSVVITEAGLDAAEVVDDQITLIDSEGDPFKIILMLIAPVAVKFEW